MFSLYISSIFLLSFNKKSKSKSKENEIFFIAFPVFHLLKSVSLFYFLQKKKSRKKNIMLSSRRFSVVALASVMIFCSCAASLVFVSANTIVTTYATSSSCVGTDPVVLNVPSTQCVVKTSSSVTYDSNNTHASVNTYTTLTCTGTPTTVYIPLDVCTSITSSSSWRFGNSNTPAPAGAESISYVCALFVSLLVSAALLV